MYYHWRSSQQEDSGAFIFCVGLVGMFLVIALIFLISANLVSIPGTTVTLPQIAGAHYQSGEKLIVVITADGKLFYNGEAVDKNRFRERLDEWVKEHTVPSHGHQAADGGTAFGLSRAKIIVCADENVRMKDWLELVGVARESGLDFILASDLQNGRNATLPKIDVSISDK